MQRLSNATVLCNGSESEQIRDGSNEMQWISDYLIRHNTPTDLEKFYLTDGSTCYARLNEKNNCIKRLR